MSRGILLLFVTLPMAACGPRSSAGADAAAGETLAAQDAADADGEVGPVGDVETVADVEDVVAVAPDPNNPCGPGGPLKAGEVCDDADPCSATSECRDWACVATFPTCFDGDVCTVDWCTAGKCLHEPYAGAGECDPDPFVMPCPTDPAAKSQKLSYAKWPSLKAHTSSEFARYHFRLNWFRTSDGGLVGLSFTHIWRLANDFGTPRLKTAFDLIGADASDITDPPGCSDTLEGPTCYQSRRPWQQTYLGDATVAPNGSVWVLGHGHSDATAEAFGKSLVASDWLLKLDANFNPVGKPVVLRERSSDDYPNDFAGDLPDRASYGTDQLVQYSLQGGRLLRLDHNLFVAVVPNAVWWSRQRAPEKWNITLYLFDDSGKVLLRRDLGHQIGGTKWSTPSMGVAWVKAVSKEDIAVMLQPSGVLLRVRARDGAIVGRRDPGEYMGYALPLPNGTFRYRRLVGPEEALAPESVLWAAAERALYKQEVAPLGAAPWPSQAGSVEEVIVRPNLFAGSASLSRRMCSGAAMRFSPHSIVREIANNRLALPERAVAEWPCITGIYGRFSFDVEDTDGSNILGRIEHGGVMAYMGTSCYIWSSEGGEFSFHSKPLFEQPPGVASTLLADLPICKACGTDSCTLSCWKISTYSICQGPAVVQKHGVLCQTQAGSVGTCNDGTCQESKEP